jgi:acetyl esterase/lipase
MDMPVAVAPAPTPAPAPSPAPSPTPTPTPTGGQSNFTLMEDIQYGQGATATGSIDLLLDIYQPEATCTAPRPTIFYVHGGGFILGDKQDQLVAAIAPRVTAEGFTFVSINYRLSGDSPVFSQEYAAFAQALVDDGLADPEGDVFDAVISAIEDGVTALRWMDANADQYCLDMSRMGYWGSSAGTIVTAQIAYGLNQFGIERPEPVFHNAWWGELFRTSDLEVGEAPFLILHGNEDPLVDYQISLDLTAQADVVGVPYAFYTLVGTGHGFDTNNREQTAAGIDASVQFAVDHLTGGTPTYGRFDLR